MPSNFIDALKLQLIHNNGSFIRAILKDDKGSVCSMWEKRIVTGEKEIMLTGLNDLPYGRYTIELVQGEDEMKLNVVKRI